MTDADWAAASLETKDLLIQVKQFMKPLEGAYWQAVRAKDWKRALLLYQRMVGSPYLSSIGPTVWDERECREREGEFIARAKEWIAEVEELLRSEGIT